MLSPEAIDEEEKEMTADETQKLIEQVRQVLAKAEAVFANLEKVDEQRLMSYGLFDLDQLSAHLEALEKETRTWALNYAIFRIKNRPRLRRSVGDPQEPPEWEDMESEEFAAGFQASIEIIEQLKTEIDQKIEEARK